MADYIFDPAGFKTQFPAFTDVLNATLQAYWDTGNNYIANQNYGWLAGAQRNLALNLITAHIAGLMASVVSTGGAPGLVQAATIDKVSVTLVPPPGDDQFSWWLNQTPYGAQLLFLLDVQSVGGFSIGGSPEILGFRRLTPYLC